MTAKQYLEQAKYLDEEINAKLEQIVRWRALAEKRTVAYGVERTSGGGSDRYDIAVKIIDEERALDERIDRLVDLKREIAQAIELVSDSKQRTLLELRYINKKSWRYIASKLHYSDSQTFDLHGKALEAIEVIKDRSKSEFEM